MSRCGNDTVQNLRQLEMRPGGIFKALLVALTVAVSFSVYFLKPGISVDLSWMTELNYLAEHGMRFGKDLVWTNGPAAFLLFPLKTSHLFLAAIAFQSLIWLVFAWALVYAVVKRETSLSQTVLFVSFFFFARAFGALADTFMVFLVIFLLALAVTARTWKIPFAMALVLTALLFFIKFTSAFIATSAIAVFVCIAWNADRRISAQAILASALSLALLVLLPYTIYVGSVAAVLAYCRGVFELIANYAGAMSLPVAPFDRVAVLSLILIYLICVWLVYRARQASFYILIIAALPLAMACKAAFVRGDIIHAAHFYELCLYVFATVFLFTNMRETILEKGRRGIAVSCLVFLFLIYPFTWKHVVTAWWAAKNYPLRHVTAARAGISSLQALLDRDRTAAIPDAAKLPPIILEAVGANTVSVFPTEGSIAIINGLKYIPFPVLQAYAAYTPYLDALSARFLEDRLSCPEYILFRWQTIDGRNPLIDAPAVWLSLYRWYGTERLFDTWLLLKRRTFPRFRDQVFIESRQLGRDDLVRIPKSTFPVVVYIHMELSIKGRLRRIFFNIPQVRARLYKDSASIADYRVVPETLGDGLFINLLPRDTATSAAVLEGRALPYAITGLQLYGPGLKYYKERVFVRYYSAKPPA